MALDALFYANAPGRLADQLRLADSLARKHGLSFEFVLQAEGMSMEMARRVREAGYPVRYLGVPEDRSSAEEGAEAQRRPLASAFRKAARLGRAAARWNTPAQWLIARRIFADLQIRFREAQDILASTRPRVLFAFGDRHGGAEFAMLKAARMAGIPVILPYMAYSDMEGLRVLRQENPFHGLPLLSPLYFRVVRRRHPSAVYKGLLYYRPSELAAYSRFGALPTNPWTMGCGLSDYVCVDNRDTYERYLTYGTPESKLRIVGDTAYDDLYRIYCRKETLRAELRERYRLRQDKKKIFIALPQFGEHMLLPWERHFREIDFLMERLADLGQDLLVSLHPKMERTRYAYLEEKFPCRILDQRLFDVLPAADAFVAINSSTVMWAVLCGIPTVVADYYEMQLGSSMFDFLTTTRVVRKREDLKLALKAAFESPLDFSKDWSALSRQKVFDGRTIDRYHQLVLKHRTSPP